MQHLENTPLPTISLIQRPNLVPLYLKSQLTHSSDETFRVTILKATYTDLTAISILAETLVYPAQGRGYLLGDYSLDALETFLFRESSEIWVSLSKEGILSGFLILEEQVPQEVSECLSESSLFEKFSSELGRSSQHRHVVAVATDPAFKKEATGKRLYKDVLGFYDYCWISSFVAVKPVPNKASLVFHKNTDFKIAATYSSAFKFGFKNYESVLLLRSPQAS